jgi:DNA primase
VIPDSFKQDLLNRVDIVDVVSSRVQLRKSGANWVGLCPFHGEKTPSFSVSQAKQFYHCFGCGAHGNAIGFLMEYAGLGYVEAVKDLAESVGLKLPEFERGGAPRREEGPNLYAVLERAARFYREQLKAAPRAIDYLKGRGVTGAIAARFGIGYAPSGWQGLSGAFDRYDDKALVEAGLVIENEGRRYDRFRDRVVFPIFNQRGLVVGFGGRVLAADDGPKYLNSPETPIFEKGRELYGLPQARDAIRAANRVVVVEGYMDVVMLAQCGVENAVATLGTATTPVHVQKLLKQADEVVFCFDGDAAGRRAAWHALEVGLEALVDRKAVRFLFLPAEHDPDSFVREFGEAGFAARLAEAEPLSGFLLRELRSRSDLATLEGRSKLIAEAKPLVKRVAAPALRMQLVKALATAAAMEPGEAARLLDVRDGVIARAPERSAPVRLERRPMVSNEEWVLRALAVTPELARLLHVEDLPDDTPEATALRGVVERIVAAPELPRPLSSAFEDSPLLSAVRKAEADVLLLGFDEAALRPEFEGARRKLEAKVKGLEINDMLARNQTDGLVERLREHKALGQPPQPPGDLAGGGGSPI